MPANLIGDTSKTLKTWPQAASSFHACLTPPHPHPRYVVTLVQLKGAAMRLALLELLSWITVSVGLASSALIVVDTRVLGYRQPITVLEFVWAVTGVYLGPVGIVAYRRWARPQSRRWQRRHGKPPTRPRHLAILTGLCHCGAHCVLGVILGELVVSFSDVSVGGQALWANYIADYSGALAVGVTFRYFTSVRRGRRRLRDAVVNVAKADLLGVTAFEIALFIWLAISHRVTHAESAMHPSSPVFWFYIQIGLASGFVVAWPGVAWLVRRGVKVTPDHAPGGAR
ncbi:DUF4396 domain-containing protein [Micromonospora azadirachtae]|uniref:DUF4396 domain-containing protein n=1 Tax=Micromonospora azadirachtae TaxID=1970735 RepID=A0ABW2ZVX8_9ACTN